ncbi:helix-turn-helix domain-containing protein [Sphingomonas nostoxanthinifaciens]|uniref:transcriptional regulator n=1 Tax=Sphingomonas nostoxanthinifaciens TaxID=2872652 RepID=UPI001CC20E7A|nr:transcriptional regulator [Sphingomonas nostoxanthinifaciens]UAK24329.1 transcriptional regulator [Sphingomonas nostoxanthinifaciens]
MNEIIRRQQVRSAQTINASETLGMNTDADIRRLTTAKAWMKARAVRNKVLGLHLFAEPAWDMLLALYIAHGEFRMLSVSAVVSYANVPSTTGLRWLTKLEDSGMISRRTDLKDGRRIFVQMLPEAIESMETIFDQVGESDARLGLSRLYFQR